MPRWGAPRGCWCGGGGLWMEIAVQTVGKAPVHSGTVTTGLPDGQTTVVVAVVVLVTLSEGPFGSTVQHILFGSVCGQADGKQADSMFSRGPGGVEDQREEILPKFHVGLAWLCRRHSTTIYSCSGVMALSLKKVNGRQNVDIRVIACTAT